MQQQTDRQFVVCNVVNPLQTNVCDVDVTVSSNLTDPFVEHFDRIGAGQTVTLRRDVYVAIPVSFSGRIADIHCRSCR
jgi:hypothetical protein